MHKLEKFGEALLSTLVRRSIGYGVFLALILALCVTSVTILLLNGMPVFDHHPPLENGWKFVAEFVLILVLVSVITTFMTSREDNAKQREADVAIREAALAARETAVAEREADDLLSKFREQISGIWEMSYRSWKFGIDGVPEEIRTNSYARFDVNARTKKLVMRTRISANGEFDDDNLCIEAISIWPVINPTHLAYYHDLNLTHENGENVRGPVFVHLDIEFDEDRPVRLRGTWYDLDGVFARAMRDSYVRGHGGVRGELPLRGRISFNRLDLAAIETRGCVDNPARLVTADSR